MPIRSAESLSLQASRFERARVAEALDPFLQDGSISDVLYTAKGGKEATVYCCRAPASSPWPLLAAKLYRPRQQRAMRNYAAYQQGRALHGEGGAFLDRREARAVRAKSAFGREVESGSWTSHEVLSLERLYEAGVPVPAPVGHQGDVILMQYLGDEHHPAPHLRQVHLSPDEAADCWQRLVLAVEDMLGAGRIHGDLSPFNILWWDGQPWIIDLPQAVDPDQNPLAWEFLERDLQRLCDWAAPYGIAAQAPAWAVELRERWEAGRL